MAYLRFYGGGVGESWLPSPTCGIDRSQSHAERIDDSFSFSGKNSFDQSCRDCIHKCLDVIHLSPRPPRRDYISTFNTHVIAKLT